MNYWRLTSKRRENLVKICLALLTADVGGFIIPFFALPLAAIGVKLFAGGIAAAIFFIFLIYALER